MIVLYGYVCAYTLIMVGDNIGSCMYPAGCFESLFVFVTRRAGQFKQDTLYVPNFKRCVWRRRDALLKVCHFSIDSFDTAGKEE